MRPTFSTRGGYTLIKSSDSRPASGRKITLAVCGFLAIAMGLLGLLTPPSPSLTKAATGPFSYIPVQ